MSLTAEELRRVLDYDPETGAFTWKVSRGKVKCGSRAGCRNGEGYIQIAFRKKLYLAHRLAWLYVHGEWPPKFIDHINNKRSDNRICNLRIATNAQNMANTPLQANNTSGVKGVTWFARDQKWKAEITVGGRVKYLGKYACIQDAAHAYRRAAIHYFGEFARVA